MSAQTDKDVEKASLIDKKVDNADSIVSEKKQGSSTKALSSCALYSFCSVSMVLVNKSLASSYNKFIDGDLNFLLVVFQAVVAVIAVQFCKMMKWVEYPAFNFKTALQWAPVNLFFCGMLFTGMASLQHNSVPMVTVFKNITNIVVTMGDYYCFGNKVEMLIILAFGIMLGGALLAAKNDVQISGVGLFWMAVNCLSTAGYILYMKFATKNVKLSKFGMVFYNNVLCTVFLLPVTFVNGEMNTFMKTEAIHTADYMLKNSYAGFVGFFLNFASLNCVSITGPTTYAIIGSMNKIPIAFLGWFLFDSVITPQTWFFIGVSMCGGFLYSYAKVSAGKRKARKQSHSG
jgi:GDP-mannose transporter